MSYPPGTLIPMLPDVMFRPLDLDDAIADAERALGAHGVVDLLVTALTDPRVLSDAEIDAYLPRLKSACRQTRRYREAIAVFHRVAELNSARRPEMVVEVATAHAHLREPATARALLVATLAEQRRLPKQQRCLTFCAMAEIAASVLRQSDLAREIAALGRASMPVARVPRPTAARQLALEGISELIPAGAVNRRRRHLELVPDLVGDLAA